MSFTRAGKLLPRNRISMPPALVLGRSPLLRDLPHRTALLVRWSSHEYHWSGGAPTMTDSLLQMTVASLPHVERDSVGHPHTWGGLRRRAAVGASSPLTLDLGTEVLVADTSGVPSVLISAAST